MLSECVYRYILQIKVHLVWCCDSRGVMPFLVNAMCSVSMVCNKMRPPYACCVVYLCVLATLLLVFLELLLLMLMMMFNRVLAFFHNFKIYVSIEMCTCT